MILEEVVQFLKDVPPFQFLENGELKAIAGDVMTEFYPRDTVIFRQDDPASNMFRIIRKGGVKVSMRARDGEDVVIDHRGEGDTFGLLSLLGRDEKQKTTVVAIEDTSCYLLKKEKLLTVIEANPSFTEYFLQSHFSRYIDKTLRELRSKSQFFGSSDHLLFTTPVGDIATRRIVSVGNGVSIREAAQTMSRERVSSVVVVDAQGNPNGIVTDLDLREKVVAKDRDLSGPVKDIMTPPLVRVDAQAPCFEAILRMIKHNVHHILVVRDGKLSGVLTNHDLMLLQGTSPLSIAQDIGNQATVDSLAAFAPRINGVVGLLLKEGAKASSISRIMTELHDRMVCKVLEIAERKFGTPPVDYCWISFGSDGRKEQPIRTDQDNGIIYADPVTPTREAAARDYFHSFTVFVRDSLVRCGFPPCKSDYMASNPHWCQPLQAWKKYFFSWAAMPTPEALQRSLICFDFRPLYGDHDLASQLRSYVHFVLTGQQVFFARMTSVATRNRPQFGFFRSLRTDTDSENRSRLNLWSGCIGPMVDIVRLMALDKHLGETSTIERIEALKGAHALISDAAEELTTAFEFATLLRIHHQSEQLREGKTPDNILDLDRMGNLEKRMLRESLQMVGRLQERALDHYRAGLIGV